VAPSGDIYENHIVRLTEQPFWKKSLILVRTMSRTRRQTKRDIQKTPIFAPTAARVVRSPPKLCTLVENVVTILKGVKINTMFPHLQPATIFPQTLHGDRAHRAHQKSWYSFFDPTHSFSYRVQGKIRPNLPTRGFSGITP